MISFYFLVFLIISLYFSLFTFLSYRFVLSNLICLIDLSHRFVVSQWRDSTLVTPGRNNKPALGGRVSVPPDPLLGEANTVSRTYLSYTVTPTMTHPRRSNKKHHSRAWWIYMIWYLYIYVFAMFDNYPSVSLTRSISLYLCASPSPQSH